MAYIEHLPQPLPSHNHKCTTSLIPFRPFNEIGSDPCNLSPHPAQNSHIGSSFKDMHCSHTGRPPGMQTYCDLNSHTGMPWLSVTEAGCGF
eukprot:385443-Pelagomonas_calceolata.AAC.1